MLGARPLRAGAHVYGIAATRVTRRTMMSRSLAPHVLNTVLHTLRMFTLSPNNDDSLQT